MAYELTPGVQQDHRGKYFQYGRYPSGKCVMVPVDATSLSAKVQAELEPILAESRSSLNLADEQLNQCTLEKLISRHLYKQGECYETIRCIHESNI